MNKKLFIFSLVGMIIFLFLSNPVLSASKMSDELEDEKEFGKVLDEKELHNFVPRYYDYEPVFQKWGKVDLTANLQKLPKSHPAYGMKPGEVRNGEVFIYCDPDPGQNYPPSLAGIPEEYQPSYELLERLMEVAEEENQKDSERDMLDYFRWYSTYYGRELESGYQIELEAVYIQQYSRLMDEITRYRKTGELKKYLSNISAILTDLNLQEYLIFRENKLKTPAGNPFNRLDYKNPKNREQVQQAYCDYFSYYMDEEYRKNFKIPETKIVLDEKYYKSNKAFLPLGSDDITYQTVSRMDVSPEWLLKNALASETTREAGTEFTTTRLSEAELMYYEFRVYSAEHPVIENYEIAGLYHVSILGGFWANFKRKKTVTTFRIPSFEVVSEDVSTQYEEIFLYWMIGNGCLGTYESFDQLILLKSYPCSNYEQARKIAYGITPSPGGKYYPMRACAYSVGTYGFSYVCQNNANAFTGKKWGFAAILSPARYTGIALYGICGLRGVSKRKCSFWPGFIFKGGIPGSGLHYNIAPEHVDEPVIAAIIESFAPAWGSGLAAYYNAKKNDWRYTGAKFTEHSIPYDLGEKTDRIYLEPGWED